MERELTRDEIWSLLDSLDTYDLIDELEKRGINVEGEDDIFLENATTEQLIDEVRARGYEILEGNLMEAVDTWNRGDKKEALFLIERGIPEMYGLKDLL